MPGRARQAPQARDNLAWSIWRRSAEHSPTSPHSRQGALPQGRGHPTVGLRTPRKGIPPQQGENPQRRGHPPRLDLKANVGPPVPGQVGDVDPVEHDVLHTAPEVLPVGEVLFFMVNHPSEEYLVGRGRVSSPLWRTPRVDILASPCPVHPPRFPGQAGRRCHGSGSA